MRGIVQWLLARRYRPVILAAAFAPAPLISVAATALTALETLRRGPAQGFASAAAATAGVFALAWIWGASPWDFGFMGGASLLAGVGLGALILRANSLALAFQGTLFLCVLAAALVALLWPEPGVLITRMVAELAELLRASGGAEEQVQAVVAGWEQLFVGLLSAGVFLHLIVSLIIGHWWATLAGFEPAFGQQFRQLRLGRFLGVPATLLMASSLVLDAPLIQNLFPLILFGFWFQGIAVVHAWGWARRWHWLLVAAMYLLLMPPFTGLTILALASVGLVDNWIDLRAPLRPLTSRE